MPLVAQAELQQRPGCEQGEGVVASGLLEPGLWESVCRQHAIAARSGERSSAGAPDRRGAPLCYVLLRFGRRRSPRPAGTRPSRMAFVVRTHPMRAGWRRRGRLALALTDAAANGAAPAWLAKAGRAAAPPPPLCCEKPPRRGRPRAHSSGIWGDRHALFWPLVCGPSGRCRGPRLSSRPARDYSVLAPALSPFRGPRPARHGPCRSPLSSPDACASPGAA